MKIKDYPVYSVGDKVKILSFSGCGWHNKTGKVITIFFSNYHIGYRVQLDRPIKIGNQLFNIARLYYHELEMQA